MIIAQIATQPGREKTLKIATDSLRKQVDTIVIMKNSKSDGNKFQGLKDYPLDTIVLICDDDIEYPPYFVEVMKKYLKPGIVVTVMGKILRLPVKSFYRDEQVRYQTFDDNDRVVQVMIPGTCGMAFFRSTCPDLDHTFFKSMNSDIWMGIYCKENNIPCFVIPHRGDWLKNLMPMLPLDTPTVYDIYKDNDSEMTELVNSRL